MQVPSLIFVVSTGFGATLTMDCPFCSSARLRNSRTRAADILHLLVLRSPVRCHNCQERLFVPFWTAKEIRRATKLRREEERLRRSSEGSPRSRS